MKSALNLCLLIGVALVLWKRRRRLSLAVRAVGLAYLAVMLVRLALVPDEADRVADVGLVLGGFALVWLALWAVTRLIVNRRDRATKRQERDSSGDDSSINRAIAER